MTVPTAAAVPGIPVRTNNGVRQIVTPAKAHELVGRGWAVVLPEGAEAYATHVDALAGRRLQDPPVSLADAPVGKKKKGRR